MRRSGKQFVYTVDNGRNPVKLRSASRYSLPKTPKSHCWDIGQEVVYAQLTAAGWMASALRGTIVAFTVSPRKAVVEWHASSDIAPTISLQRLRPALLVDNFLSLPQ